MENFTPMTGFAGGVLIGLSAIGLALTLGRIAGISGILGGLFGSDRREWGWRAAFILGVFGGPFLVALLGGTVPVPVVVGSLPLLIAGGVLVGFGTRMGGGCTSGHGVCGLGRFSPRSLVATCVFMGVSGVTVFILRHVVGG